MPNLDRFSTPMSWEYSEPVSNYDEFEIKMFIEDFYEVNGDVPDIFEIRDEFDLTDEDMDLAARLLRIFDVRG